MPKSCDNKQQRDREKTHNHFCFSFFFTLSPVAEIEIKGDLPIRRIIERLGGWPVLEGSNWDTKTQNETFDLIELQKTLQDLGVIDDMILSLGVMAHSKNNSVNIIGLSQPSFGLMDRDMMIQNLREDVNLKRYYRLMLYTAKLLNDTEFAKQASHSASTLFDFSNFDRRLFLRDIVLPEQTKRDLLDALYFEQKLANVSLKIDK